MTHYEGRLRSRRARARTTITLLTAALLAALVLGGSAQAASPPTVLLGTASAFAVLSGAGITNTGVTTIGGDTGSSQPNVTETGFTVCPGAADCVTQTGTNHDTVAEPNDQATQNARTDSTTAFNDAAGRTPTAVPSELGGQTLVAGVYATASTAFGMTGTLTLDGANNADSVFIFQAPGGFTSTGTAANVVLENGAQACNVFWEVGSATLSAGSGFVGTLMSDASITVGSGTIINGRLQANEAPGGSGSVTLIHDTVNVPTTCVTQASVNEAAAAAAAAAQAAADQAAAAAAAAQTAIDTAAAAQLAATQAAAATAATAAAQAAQVAATKAAAAAAAATRARRAARNAATAARVAAAKAALAKVNAAKVAAAKAAAAAKLAAAHAAAAKLAAARAAKAKLAAAVAAKAAKAKVAAATHAHAAVAHVGLTG
jgi:chemotaxis protein histidine kinase CheA